MSRIVCLEAYSEPNARIAGKQGAQLEYPATYATERQSASAHNEVLTVY